MSIEPMLNIDLIDKIVYNLTIGLICQLKGTQ